MAAEVGRMKVDERQLLPHFSLGIMLMVMVQTLCMFGGLVVERRLGVFVTGIPSSVGLFLVLLVAGTLSKKLSDYVLLGAFTFAFVAPLILFVVVLLKALPVMQPQTNWSLAYMIVLTATVWIYFLARIFRGKM
jgi:hypothetical protein